MTSPSTSTMQMWLDGKECDQINIGESAINCKTDGVLSKNVNLRLSKDDLMLVNEDFSVLHADPKILSVRPAADTSNNNSWLQIVFDGDISCFDTEDFIFVLNSSKGSFEISNSDEKKMSLPDSFYLSLPEADFEKDSELKIESYIYLNGEKKKIEETSFSLSSGVKEKELRNLDQQKLRVLAPTKLIWIYPDTIFANTNPISLKLTFDESISSGDISSVTISLVSGSSNYQMTVSSIADGELIITYTNNSGINTGTYQFSVNSGGISTQNVFLTVKPTFIFAWFDTNYPCPGTAFTTKLTFNQKLSTDTIKSAKIKKVVNGALTEYAFTLGNISDNNQLSVSIAAAANTERGTYEISVVDYLDTTHVCIKEFYIGYPYSLTSVSNLYYGVGASCGLSPVFDFDRNVDMNHFKNFKFGVTAFSTTTRNTSDNSKVDASIGGNQSVGSNALTATDQCDRVITNDANQNLVIWQIPGIDTLSVNCAQEGVATSLTVTFLSDLDSNVYTDLALRDTTTSADISLGKGTISQDTTLVSVNSSIVGTYYVVGKSLCSNESSSASVTPTALTFEITKKPTLVSTGPTNFDINKVKTHIIFNKAISNNDFDSISMSNGVITYTPTVSYPADNTSKMDILQTNVNAGTYTITVTFGCSHTQTMTVNVDAVPVISSDTVGCYKQNSNISFSTTFSTSILAGLIYDAKIFSKDPTPVDKGSLTVTQDSNSSALFNLVKTSGVAETGKYVYKFYDNSDTEISFTNEMEIIEAYSPTIDISVWDVSSNFSFIATFDKSFVADTQIVSFKLTKTDDNTVTFSSSSKTENVAQKKITVSFTTAVNVAGLYTVKAIDRCNIEHQFTTNLRITTVPTISSLTPLCVLEMAPFLMTVNFNQNIYSTQFKSSSLKDSGINLTIAYYDSKSLTVSGSTGLTTGDYPLSIIDMADQTILSTQKMKIVHTMSPTLSVSPIIYDNNYEFVLTVSTKETLVTNQMDTAKLQLSGQTPINFSITSQGQNQVVLQAKTLNLNGLYDLILTDVCGQTYTLNNAIRIVSIPVVTQISQICYNQNEAINNLVVTFDKNVYTGQFRAFKIFDNDDDTQTGTGSINSIGANNFSVNVSNTAISNLGLYYLAFTDVAYVSIPYTFKKIRILPATFSIVSFTPMTWDSGVPITLVITFNQTVQDGQVVSVKLTSTLGQTYVVTYSGRSGSTWTGTVTIPKTNGNSSVMHTLSLTDFCENTVTTSTQLQIVDIPTAQPLDPYCYVKNLSQSINLDFSSLPTLVENTRQIKEVKLSHVLTGAITTLTLGNKNVNTQTVTLPSISSAGNYNIIITDLADQNVPTDSVLRIRNNASAANLNSYDYSIWRTDLQINWKLYFDRNVDIDEMVSVSLKRTSDSLEMMGSLETNTGSQNSVTVSFLEMDSGNYNFILKDICGRTITGPVLTITVPPIITSYSTSYISKNEKYNLWANFDKSFPLNYFSSIKAFESYSEQMTSMEMGATNLSSGYIKNLSTPNVGLPMGVYSLIFQDVTGTLNYHINKILVLDKLAKPEIQSISPNFFLPGEFINFSVTLDSLLIREQFSSVKLTCSDNVVNTMTITNVSGNKLSATFPGILVIGNCSVKIIDFTTHTITTPLEISIVNPLKEAEISSFSPTCSVKNKAFNLTINLNKNLLLGISIASSFLLDTANPNNLIPIPLTPPATSSPFTASFENGVADDGVYKIRLSDNINTSVTSGHSIKILAQDPRIVEIKPSIVRYDGFSVNFSAFFDVFLFSSDLVEVYMIDSLTNMQVPSLLTGVIDNEVKVSIINFVPGKQSYTPVFRLCNTVVRGPTFYIQPQETIPVIPTNTTDNNGNPVCKDDEEFDPLTSKCLPKIIKPNCLQYQVYNSTSNTCYTCDSIGQYNFNNACIDKCLENYSLYSGTICVASCSAFALVSYQNNCVPKCPSSFGTSFGTCIDCTKAGLYYFSDSCVVQCPSGYTPSTSGQCQIAINLYGNTQGVTCANNPCNGGTCQMVLGNQVSCSCPADRVGVLCETLKASVTSASIDNIVTQITSTQDINSEKLYKSMNLQNYLNSNINSPLVTTENSNRIYTYTVNNLQTLTQKNNLTESDANILKLVNLAINFKELELNIPKGRVLQVNQQVSSQIQNLLNMTQNFVSNYISSRSDFPTNKSTLMGDTYVSFHVATNTPASMSDFMSQSSSNNLVVANLTNCLNKLGNSNSYIINKLDYSTSINKYLNVSDSSSSKIFLGVNDRNTRKSVDISSCSDSNSINIKYPLTNSQKSLISLPTYRKWKDLGVDTYDTSDPVFNSRCSHLGNKLNYDTTENYRRAKIFSNMTLTCTGASCTYVGIDTSNRVNCNCRQTSTEAGIYTTMNKFVFEPTSDINLDLANCPHIAFTQDQVYRNAGFWTGLFVIIALIIVFCLNRWVFNRCVADEGHRESSLVFDRIKHRDEANLAVEHGEQRPSEGPIKVGDEKPAVDPKEVHIEMEKVQTEVISKNKSSKKHSLKRPDEETRGFCTVFCETLFEVHPVLNLVYHSLVLPFGVKVSLFLFNSFMYFSFNAFVFTDTYIHMRMDNEDRDNFGYPMRNEFGKIIASIAITLGLNVILKLIVLPSSQGLESLKSKFNMRNQNKEEDDEAKCNKYHDSMSVRYIIAFVIISIFCLFFFYYDFVFCAVYVNASPGWFYSGIWSLIWVWFAFAPFTALVLAIMEQCCSFARTHSIYCHWLFCRLLF